MRKLLLINLNSESIAVMKCIIVSLILIGKSHSFVSQIAPLFGVRSHQAVSSTVREDVDVNNDTLSLSASVRAPLKWLGPYPSLELRFPGLATSSQRTRNVTGVSLDFVLDTAANTNTINAQAALELELMVVGQALSGVGASGAIEGGDTYMLGDCQLDGLPAEEDSFTFMTGLTASALSVSNPAAAGLLSLAFLQCFEGGVEFAWGRFEDGKITEIPSVTFHGDMAMPVESLERASIKRIPLLQLPSITIKVNGVEMPALLDTGSPITVLNAQAAKAAGIETMDFPTNFDTRNPIAKMATNLKIAQAAAKGQVLQLAGSNGQLINLIKSQNEAKVQVVRDNEGVIEFGDSHVFVGELPGLAALNGIGVDSPPAVVLGMDVLRKRSRMWLRAQQDEVYF